MGATVIGMGTLLTPVQLLEGFDDSQVTVRQAALY